MRDAQKLIDFIKKWIGQIISASGAGGVATSGLREFLESADLVKFAGVEATKEMANSATDSARTYLKSDSVSPAGGA